MMSKQNVLIAATLLLLGLCSTLAQAQQRQRMGVAPASLTFPEGKEVVEIPFTLDRDKIVMPVRVNGSEPLPFVLDTGAPIAALTNGELAKTIDLTITGQAMLGGAGSGEAKSVDLASNVTLEFGGIEITGETMAVGVGEGAMPDAGWIGVFGGSLFRNLVVEIDFANEMLRLYPPDTYAYSGEGAVLPLTLERGSFPFVDCNISIDGGAAVSTPLVIDTGAGHALSLYVDSIDGLDLPDNTVQAVLGWGVNGIVRGQTGRITSFTLGDYTLHDMVVSFPTASSTQSMRRGRTANLGVKTLKRFTVTFDYAGSRVILEPNQHLDEAFAFNGSGLTPLPWAQGADYFEVADVIAASPAVDAGIEVGDQIVEINGASVAAIEADDVYALFEQAPGTTLRLTVRRGSQTFEKKLKLEELI